jgi:hypothetical protein
VKREKFQLPSVDETLSKLQDAKFFSKLDFSSGFWQINLEKNSQKLRTFISPFGRYKYKRIPFGITSAPEVFQKVLYEILSKLKSEQVQVHADDILITGRTIEEHDRNLHKVLRLIEENGLTLNKEKCIFQATETSYLGYVVSDEGIKADPKCVEAIKQFREPKNQNEVRQFLGMANYVFKFISNVADKTQLLRELLQKDRQFMWTVNHQREFDKLKNEIVSPKVLAKFDVNKKSRVSADASSFGIGAVLEQLQEDDNWKPVYFCSKSLSPTERGYAQIEKEALAITWACERLEQYLLGAKFIVQTDHKPLTVILKTREVNKLTNRLQRFRMRLLKFNFDICYVPGR